MKMFTIQYSEFYKFALLWVKLSCVCLMFAYRKKIAFSYPKLTYSYPRVTYSGLDVTFREPNVTHSDPTHLPLHPPTSPGQHLAIS